MQFSKFQKLVCAALVAIVCVDFNLAAAADNQQQLSSKISSIVKRSDDKHKHHHSMVHNHLSRKVFDRACAASKDTIDEIVACITGNEALTKSVKPDIGINCHKDAFGIDFDPKDINKHKELICNNREKFEDMTACMYHKMAESLDPKEMQKMTEAMVDVGLCIINALDG